MSVTRWLLARTVGDGGDDETIFPMEFWGPRGWTTDPSRATDYDNRYLAQWYADHERPHSKAVEWIS